MIKYKLYQIQNSNIHQSPKIMNWLRANRVGVKDPTANRNNTFIGRSSVDTKNKPASETDISTPDKIKSNPSFSLQKIDTKVVDNPKTTASNVIRKKDQFRLPNLKRTNLNQQNPESEKNISQHKEIFYQSQVYRALQTQQTTYLMTLARQHFYQTIEALRITRNIRLVAPKKQIKLEKKSPFKKTIYLDLDQTLIHTDERSTSFSVKLTFPIETGGSIQAGVRIRPFCKEFLTQLAKFAQIIIFTASSASYADVILDYLDPDKSIFSYRLYRHHCTLQRGFYIKDLRAVNRRLEDVVIVDNSAFSFLLQPQNGIPILPFYHFSKDRELLTLLQYLREIVNEEDLRENIKKTFFFDAYLKDNNDPKRLFFKRFKKLLQQSSSSPQ